MKIATTPAFWDCECEKDFIRPRTQNGCSLCGAQRYEQPDSRFSEVEGKYDVQIVVHTYPGSSETLCELIVLNKGMTELDVQPDTGRGLLEDNPLGHYTLATNRTILMLQEWAEKYGYPFPTNSQDFILCQHSDIFPGGFKRTIHPIFNL